MADSLPSQEAHDTRSPSRSEEPSNLEASGSGGSEAESSEYDDAVGPPSEEDDEEDEEESIIERLLAAAGEDSDEEDDEDNPQIEVEIQTMAEDGVGTNRERIFLSRDQIQRFLRLRATGVDSDDWLPRSSRRNLDPDRFPKVPSDAGIELMKSGTFGSNDAETTTQGGRTDVAKRKRLARRIFDRELAADPPAKRRLNQRLMAQGMIPASTPDMIIHYDQPVYSGQFSDDGNFFFSANKDYKVRMYDTSNPYQWRYYKSVQYYHGQWTLTDATLSPDNKWLAYSSIRHTVCLAPTDPNDLGDPYILDFSDNGTNRRFGGAFGIWSVRFSGDGRQLVAGTNGGTIITYDIESRRTTNRIMGHDEDVNAVCFADSSSPHILYSGSDDTTLKVWDTRSMGDSRAAGAFIGHIEGLTYIDSKGDGRYILSNGKDQSMKLWDLRMVMSNDTFERINPRRQAMTSQHFDYRWGSYDESEWYQDPHDNSVVTFRGHKVLRTLIRCHFSPPASTNSRYVYSGSEDGKVYIWNMDATLAGVVDVYASTKNSRPHGRHEYDMIGGGWDENGHSTWRTCVRDASWHPNAPMIVASAWNGYGMSSGTCTVHSWNDGAEDDEAEPKMGLRVDQKLNTKDEYYRVPADPPRRRRRFGLRSLRDDDDD